MTLPEQPCLQALLDKWQPRLGLMHWRIQVRVARHFEMDLSSHLAEVRFNFCALRADILVQDPNDCEANPDFFQHEDICVEQSIIHELLHLVLAPIEDRVSSEDADGDFERAIHVLERALMGG